MISKWLVHAYACGKVHPQVGLTLKLITDGYSACKLQHIGPYVVKDRSPVSLNIDYLGRRLMHAAAGDLQDTTLCIFRSKVSKEVRRRNTFHAIVHRITAISGSLYRCRRIVLSRRLQHAMLTRSFPSAKMSSWGRSRRFFTRVLHVARHRVTGSRLHCVAFAYL